MIKAIVMAGGKGTRLNSDIEKPLIPLNKKPLICHVISNLFSSKHIDEIIVATSDNTLETLKFLNEKYGISDYSKNKDLNLHTSNDNGLININLNDSTNSTNTKINNKNIYYLHTLGEDFLKDISFILNYFENISSKDVLLFINADLPLISTKIINEVIEEYFKSNLMALSTYLPLSIFNKLNITPSFVFNGLVPIGLNILLSKNIIQDEHILILEKDELAININHIEDLKVAESYFK
jgi:adenosylcobinamide-phosphate guanylyltransferase